MCVILFNLILLVVEILCTQLLSVSDTSLMRLGADLYGFVVQQRVNGDGCGFVVRCICLATELRPGEVVREARQTWRLGEGKTIYYTDSPPRRGMDREPRICGHGRESDSRIVPTELVSLQRHRQRPHVESGLATH